MGDVININGTKRNTNVILHSAKRRKRGRKASTAYYGVRNPELAHIFAVYSVKFGTISDVNGSKEPCFALFNENEEVKIPEYALVRDDESYPEILAKMLEEDFSENKYKHAVILGPDNSLVIAQGDNVDKVLEEAKKIGVANPVLLCF